jgi:ribose transport system ATP-binding protein
MSTSRSFAGEIHGLVGENGAGKVDADEDHRRRAPDFPGPMLLDGRECISLAARRAAAGIGMVHQELSVAPDLTVAENVFLGTSRPTARLVDWRRMAREAASSSSSSASTSIRCRGSATCRSACSS